MNARIMTLLLWHMTAYLLAILILWPLGFGHDREPTVCWWLERPLRLAVAGSARSRGTLLFSLQRVRQVSPSA